MIRESGHFDLDDDLAPFIDYEAYGQKQINAEGGVFNDQGYIAFRGENRGDNIIKELMKQASAELQGHLQTRLHFKGR